MIGAGEAALIGAAVASVTSISAMLLQQRWSRVRETSREEREDRLHAARLEREDRLRFANERRAAYADFMAGCVQIFARAHAQSGYGDRKPPRNSYQPYHPAQNDVGWSSRSPTRPCSVSQRPAY